MYDVQLNERLIIFLCIIIERKIFLQVYKIKNNFFIFIFLY